MESEENIQNMVAQVKHPAINDSLVNLGIVKNVSVEDGKVKLLFAFPFAGIPIGDQLIKSVTDVLAQQDIDTETEVVVMTQEERNRFLALEQQNWTGGV